MSTGRSDITVDLLNDGTVQLYQGAYSYAYQQAFAAVKGPYRFEASFDNSTKNFYDYQSDSHQIPAVDASSVHVDALRDGQLRFSWAPVEHDRPLWYTLWIGTDNDGQYDEALVVYNLTTSSTVIAAADLPDGPLVITIWARDGSKGETANNRSYSAWIPYQKPGGPLDSDGDGVPDDDDNCPAIANPDQSDVNGNGIGDVCDTGSDTDNDGLSDAYEVQIGTDPNNPDTDGDGVGDGADANPLTINANILDFSLLHTTLGDGSQVAQIIFKLSPSNASLGSLAAVVKDPVGTTYAFRRQRPLRDGFLRQNFPLAHRGESATLTVTDALGGSVSRADSYTGLAITPRVDVTRWVHYVRQLNGAYVFQWPQVDAAYSDHYRLRITDSSEDTVYKSALAQQRCYSPPGVLNGTDPDACSFQIETADRDVFDLVFNRSLTVMFPFTANDVNTPGLLNNPVVDNRFEIGRHAEGRGGLRPATRNCL